MHRAARRLFRPGYFCHFLEPMRENEKNYIGATPRLDPPDSLAVPMDQAAAA
jgi:hypothetical protein